MLLAFAISSDASLKHESPCLKAAWVAFANAVSTWGIVLISVVRADPRDVLLLMLIFCRRNLRIAQKERIYLALAGPGLRFEKKW